MERGFPILLDDNTIRVTAVTGPLKRKHPVRRSCGKRWRWTAIIRIPSGAGTWDAMAVTWTGGRRAEGERDGLRAAGLYWSADECVPRSLRPLRERSLCYEIRRTDSVFICCARPTTCIHILGVSCARIGCGLRTARGVRGIRPPEFYRFTWYRTPSVLCIYREFSSHDFKTLCHWRTRFAALYERGISAVFLFPNSSNRTARGSLDFFPHFYRTIWIRREVYSVLPHFRIRPLHCYDLNEKKNFKFKFSKNSGPLGTHWIYGWTHGLRLLSFLERKLSYFYSENILRFTPLNSPENDFYFF